MFGLIKYFCLLESMFVDIVEIPLHRKKATFNENLHLVRLLDGFIFVIIATIPLSLNLAFLACSYHNILALPLGKM